MKMLLSVSQANKSYTQPKGISIFMFFFLKKPSYGLAD